MRIAALAIVAVLPVRAHALITGVDEATDICPANADPCQINQVVQVVDNAVLDFGVRAVEVLGSGRIDALNADFTLKCGKLRLLTGTAQAINLKGTFGAETAGGSATIDVQRRCSDDLAVTCVKELDCGRVNAGSCAVGDGSVLIAGRIFGSADSPGSVSIAAAGSVDVNQQIQLSSTNANGDGGFLEIESGESTITMNEKLMAQGGGFSYGGEIFLTAHEDVVINKAIDVSGGDFDGGAVEIEAGRDILVSAEINASSLLGGGSGGEIAFDAGRDITVTGGTSTNRLMLQTNGHEFDAEYGGDGGIQDYYARRDIYFGQFAFLNASGAQPDGYGGEITFDAGRNVVVDADVTARAKGIYGLAGCVSAFSEGATTFTALSKIDLTGGDGAGELAVETTGPITFAGVVDATTAADASTGYADFYSSAGNVTVSGDITVSGDVFSGGEVVTFEGCEVRFTGASDIEDLTTGAVTAVTGHERIVVDAGALLRAPSGANTFRYRDAAEPPVVNGTVSPAAQSTLDPVLFACPVCGNGILEQTETCDDGNTAAGDGCNATCQDEGCIAQTPGFPNTVLCDDGMSCTADACDDAANSCTHLEACGDLGPCTDDACGFNGDCIHIPHDDRCGDNIACTHDSCRLDGRCANVRDNSLCDDGIACTAKDTCGVAGCTHTFDHSQCNDSNVCTNDQCVADVGCTNAFNSLTCDDGVSCTVGDACGEGICAGVPDCPDGQVCHPNLDVCGAPTTTTSTTTTTTTTSTTSTTIEPPTTTVVLPPTTTIASPTTTIATTTTVPPSTTLGPTTTTVPETTTTIAGADCGNSQVEEGEQCDTGGTPWSSGHYCRDCQILDCGDSDDSGSKTASDALFALRAAVHAVTCDCVCDVDGSGSITASDALRVLRKAIGVDIALTCPCAAG